ncbi:class I adenylate-forming enzyme family protein [Mycobacterium sp. UM_Kg1]|uniref:class I adenylate-forming enzyme family protein n=1 Tax=Mycobacterium sp. UM_Kg1 TaxID=1545691 RepID=UPI00061A8E8C|nr:class I adenylate-forming enzyme family protein [Mycobacterium sp. UM_Kg1]
MTCPTGLLGNAGLRAAGLRARYRAAGHWTQQPLDLVRDTAARHPDRIALIDRCEQISFAELDGRIDRICRELTGAGAVPGSAVVVVAGNDVDSVAAVHAVQRCDGVVLLVPRSAGAAQIASIIDRTGASFGLAPNWPTAAEELATRCRWIANPSDLPGAPVPLRPHRPADEPSFVLYTSGTTAEPKGVVHSLSTLHKASANYVAAAGLGPADRIFLISPLASVTGVVQALFVGPMLAAPIVLEDRWDPARTCEFLLSSGATWYGGPDRLLDRLLDEAVARESSVPLRAVYLGGTMLDPRIVERIEDEFGIVVMRAYGSSEVPVSTSGQRTDARQVRHADDGVPLADVEVRLGSSGDPAECCIRGPHTFLGYTDPAADDTAFEGEWFRTGDVAEVEAGRVRIVGRIKDIVIRNGMKIPAAEVEQAVAGIAGVGECAAYSVPDATTGERLALALVLDGDTELSLAELTEALVSAGLPKYKLPEELVFWDQPLPVNANGKVARNRLHEHAAGRPRAVADRLVATD